jgi:hypothetical protein
MPGVIGAIDCTHVAIVRPTIHEEHFVNRKGYHSMNVQAVSVGDIDDFKLDTFSIHTCRPSLLFDVCRFAIMT